MGTSRTKLDLEYSWLYTKELQPELFGVKGAVPSCRWWTPWALLTVPLGRG
jgi:hypothetical protein